MASLRSTETLQKEHDLQADYTARINLTLQNTNRPEYREELEDVAVFANVLRKFVPDPVVVILHERPEIILIGETEDYKITLYVNGNCWGFKVNNSPHYILEDGEKLGPGRLLKKIWDAVIPNLPENFIVRGVVDPKDPPEETEARTSLQGKLGFGSPQPNNEVYGIVKDKTLCPLTLEELTTLTGNTPNQLNQKFNVKRIVWPGV